MYLGNVGGEVDAMISALYRFDCCPHLFIGLNYLMTFVVYFVRSLINFGLFA